MVLSTLFSHVHKYLKTVNITLKWWESETKEPPGLFDSESSDDEDEDDVSPMEKQQLTDPKVIREQLNKIMDMIITMPCLEDFTIELTCFPGVSDSTDYIYKLFFERRQLLLEKGVSKFTLYIFHVPHVQSGDACALNRQ